MGHRTLSLALAFGALFLDSEAFEELREDDNPFIEGLFLVVLLGTIIGLAGLVGQVLAWAVTPDMRAVEGAVLATLQGQPWWAELAATPAGLATFQRWWDVAWQVLPGLLGAPALDAAVVNLLWAPLAAVLSWLVYGVLAHFFARLMGGVGTLNQTLGTTALAFMPLVFRGLSFIPFLMIGGALQTWQLILRYKALRTAHRLSWAQAFWATVLPFGVYALFWLALAALGALLLAAGR
ncbi:MAG: Yip1 family protein [Anaerolineae bacterium]